MPRNLPPTLIVEVTRSVFVSITVIVPSRSFVTKANGPAGLFVQFVSTSNRKQNSTQRRKGAKEFHFSFFSPLRLCEHTSPNFMTEIAPSSAATTHLHHKGVADAVDRKDQAGPSVCDNPPLASPRRYGVTRDQYSRPKAAQTPHIHQQETLRQNSDLYSSPCGSLPTAQSSAHSMQTLSVRAKALRVPVVSPFHAPGIRPTTFLRSQSSHSSAGVFSASTSAFTVFRPTWSLPNGIRYGSDSISKRRASRTNKFPSRILNRSKNVSTSRTIPSTRPIRRWLRSSSGLSRQSLNKFISSLRRSVMESKRLPAQTPGTRSGSQLRLRTSHFYTSERMCCRSSEKETARSTREELPPSAPWKKWLPLTGQSR